MASLEEARSTIEGTYGELATVDAVRQVRTRKALKKRSKEKMKELTAKDEEIQHLQHQLEVHFNLLKVLRHIIVLSEVYCNWITGHQ